MFPMNSLGVAMKGKNWLVAFVIAVFYASVVLQKQDYKTQLDT